MIENEDDSHCIQIPYDLLVPLTNNLIENIVIAIYDNFQIYYANLEYHRQRAIITPYNETVDLINTYALDLILGTTKIYYSTDLILHTSDCIPDHQLIYPIEFLNSLKFPGLPNYALELKVGTVIMLLRNLNKNSSLYNGTKLIVTQFAHIIIKGKIICSIETNNRFYIP